MNIIFTLTDEDVGTCKLSRIEQSPEEKLEEFSKRTDLHKKIGQTNWNKISTEVMEKVVDLVSPSGSEVSPKDNRYTLTLEHMPNLWLRNGYHGAKPLGNNPKYVKVNSLENASKVFSEWVINNNLGTGNLTVFSGTLVNSDNILVARIAINGKVFGLDGICIYTP